MRILLRNVVTKQYLRSNGGTNDIDQAFDFEGGAAAVTFATDHDLSEVEVIYAFPDPDYNFCTGLVGLRRPTEISTLLPGRYCSPSP